MTKDQAIFELYLWQYNRGGMSNFHALLFDLIAKADPGNLFRLRKGFPMEVDIYLEWYRAESSTAFFRRYNVGDEPGKML